MFNSAYWFIWDAVFDWALVQFTFSKPGGGVYDVPRISIRLNLEKKHLFRSKYSYIACLFINALLRVSWIMRITDYEEYFIGSGFIVLSLLEIARRFLWVCLRVEKEIITLTDTQQLTRDVLYMSEMDL